MKFHLMLHGAAGGYLWDQGKFVSESHKLIAPKWIGMNGAFATKSPSGPNSAHEKSSRSLILVLIEVCWRLRPMASATLMNRLAKSVNRIGSGPFGSLIVAVVRVEVW